MMGAARKARLAASKHNLVLIRGGKDPLPVPAPVPPVRVTDLHILVPQEIVDGIQKLHQCFLGTFPNRNEFLVALLHDGMARAVEMVAAVMAKKDQGSLRVVDETPTPEPPAPVQIG